MEKLWSYYNDYVNSELMYDSPSDEILSFDEFAERRYGADKKEAEEWFLANSDA